MDELTAEGFLGWAAYEQEERWGWRPDRLAAADLMAVLANVYRTKGDPLTRDDFLPHPKGEDRPEAIADRASQVRAGGGVVLALPALISVTSTDPPAE